MKIFVCLCVCVCVERDGYRLDDLIEVHSWSCTIFSLVFLLFLLFMYACSEFVNLNKMFLIQSECVRRFKLIKVNEFESVLISRVELLKKGQKRFDDI